MDTVKHQELIIEADKKNCGLHSCLRHAMRLSRWAGFFPVQGLGQTNVDRIRFKIKCLYSSYYVMTVVGQIVMTCFAFLWYCQNEYTLINLANIVFYFTAVIATFLLLKLSLQWTNLMKKAVETEQGLTDVFFDKRNVKKSSIIAYVTMILALVEHILCTNFNMKFVMNCLHESELNEGVMQNYVMHRMPYVFNYIPYNVFSALLFELICIQATFLWSFTDVVIICFSIYFTSYFQSLNKLIAVNAKKDKNGLPWAKIREHHSSLVNLVIEIDSQINSFVLLSFFTDLFFICLQLFNSLHRNHISFKYCNEAETSLALSSPDYLLYYLYSFFYLVLRALMLSLYASNVHNEALEALYSVYDVPTSAYDNEVHRFQLQLHHTKVGLTGKFFYVTRSMVLKVVGTIITYELVLLQYSVEPVSYNGTKVITSAANVTPSYGQV